MPAVSGLLLAFDVGNTNTVIGLFDGKHLTRHWRLTTAAERTSDEYGILMWSLFQAVGHQIPKVSGTIVASVVPPLTSTVEALSQDYFGCKALVVGPGVKTGMPILYENPREVGADRIVNSVAAHERWPQGAITPPRYSPFGLTTSHVVAVPKSTTMQPPRTSS